MSTTVVAHDRVDDIALVAEDGAQFCELMYCVMLAAGLTAGKLAEAGGHPRATYYTYVTRSKSKPRRLPTLSEHVTAWFTNCGLSDERVHDAVRLWTQLCEQKKSAKKSVAQGNASSGTTKHPAVEAYEQFVALNPLPPVTAQATPVPMPVIVIQPAGIDHSVAALPVIPCTGNVGDKGIVEDWPQDPPRTRIARAALRRRRARIAALTVSVLVWMLSMLAWAALKMSNPGTEIVAVLVLTAAVLVVVSVGFVLGRLSVAVWRAMTLHTRPPQADALVVEPELPTSSEVKQAVAQALEGQPRALATVMAEYERAQLEATATVTSLREASARAADLAAIKEAQGRAELVAAGVLAHRSASWKVNGKYPTMSPSGFVSWVYRAAGLSLPSTPRGLSAVGEPVRSTGALQLGDVVFVRGASGDQVGIYGGAGELVQLDATTHEVVRTALERERVRAVRRVGYRGRRFRMPALGPDTDPRARQLVVVQRWVKPIGSRVLVDEPIIAVECDGEALTLAAPVEGVLVQHSVAPTDVVDFGQVLGVIEALDDTVLAPDTTPEPEPEQVASTPPAVAEDELESGLPHGADAVARRAFMLAAREVGCRPSILSDSSAQFVRRIYAAAGITLPDLIEEGTLVGRLVGPEAVGLGDIVFADGGRVGIYAGGGDLIEYLMSTRRVAKRPLGTSPWIARSVCGEGSRPADTEMFAVVDNTAGTRSQAAATTEVDDAYSEFDAGPGLLVVRAAKLDRMPDHGVAPALGLVRYAFAKAGVELPSTLEDLKQVGTAATADALRPGDLVIDEADDRAQVSIYAGSGRAVTARPTGEVVICGLKRERDLIVRRIDFGPRDPGR